MTGDAVSAGPYDDAVGRPAVGILALLAAAPLAADGGAAAPEESRLPPPEVSARYFYDRLSDGFDDWQSVSLDVRQRFELASLDARHAAPDASGFR